MPKQPQSQKQSDQTTQTTQPEGTNPVPTATETNPTSPAPAATETNPTSPAPAADQPEKISTEVLVERYTGQFTAFVASDTAIDADSLPSALVDAFRALPPATRGKGSASAMKAAMRSGADVDRIADADEAIGRAASKSAPKVSTPTDPNLAGGERIAAALLALVAIGSALPADADPAVSLSRALTLVDATGTSADAILSALETLGSLPSVTNPSDAQTRVLSSAGRAVAALSRSGKGGSGQRQSIDRSLANVADGPLTLTHQGQTHKATLKGGAIVIGKESFDNPTAAAKSVLPADSSVNGWVVWKRDGSTLADLHPSA